MFAWNFFKSPFCSWRLKLQWVLWRLPPPTPSTTTLLIPTLAQQQEEGNAGVVAWPPPSRGQATLGCYCWLARPQSCMTKWLANREAIHRWRWRWERRRRRRRRRWKWRCNLVKRVLNSKGTYKSRKWIGLVHNLTNMLNSNNNNINIKMPVSKELAQWSCMFFMQ